MAAAAEALRAERDRRRRIVACLQRPNDTAVFLVGATNLLLDLQDALEDGATLIQGMTVAAAEQPAQANALAKFNSGVTIANELFSKLVLAIRYDCTSVQQTMDTEEPLPGVTPATVRAIRNTYTTRVEAERKLKEAKPKGFRNPFSNPYTALNAAVAAAGGSSGQQSAAASQALSLPQPVPAGNPKEKYACHACGIRGHWKGDATCRPEDVRAHIARLTALISSQGSQLALPAPSGSKGMSQIVQKS